MADSNLVIDYQADFSGGVDAGVSPQRVAANRVKERQNPPEFLPPSYYTPLLLALLLRNNLNVFHGY